MAAYAAVISLSNTIDRLLNHNQISISPEQEQQLQSLLQHTNSFEAFLEEFPDKFNSLEGRMRELAHEAEDIIEYFMLNQVSYQTIVIMTLLKKKINYIHSKEYERGVDSPAALPSSSTAPPIRKDSVACFEGIVIHIKQHLCGEPSKLEVISICGMACIGKTTMARYLYHHPLIIEHFEIRVWVKISFYNSLQRILSSILESLEEYTKVVKGQSDDENVAEVYKILTGRRYLIVIDDIWNSCGWDKIRRVFPDNHNGSRVMVTTVSSSVAYKLVDPSRKVYELRLLKEDESWDGLKRKVFGDEECPSELENIGMDIARCCKGWTLALVMIAEILSTTTRTCASWKEWAEEYRDESGCYQHELQLGKVLEEICLIAGEATMLLLQRGAASSAALSSSSVDSIINDSNPVQFSAAASLSGKKNNIKQDMVQLDYSSSSSNGVERGAASSAALSSSSTAPPIHKDAMVGFEDYMLDLHKLHLQKVREEIGLMAGEVREIKDSSSNDVQLGAAPSGALSSSSADSINNSNTMQLSAAASSSGKVMSMVQLGDSSSSSNAVQHIMVGFEDYLIDLKDRLCGEPSKKLQVIPILGMGGIGKTTLARNVYRDRLITNHFDIRVWVTISQDFSAQRILSSLVESLKEFDKGGLGHSDDEKVHKILFGRRYLVVMDDIWSREAWDVVGRIFPDDGNGSRVMLTTRLSDVASYPDPSSKLCEVSLLNADESWNLLKQNVFGDEDCPSELEDIGKQIAGGCKGLPLAIVVIAGHLSTTMKSLDSWKVIAENVKSAAHDQIEEILALSYVHLPQYLRPCFLYMGSFPEDHEIHVKRLITLWIAEGFVKSPIDSVSFEKVAEEFLEELVKRNLVLVTKRKWNGRIKSCSIHDLMRDLCIRKSHESMFLLNMRDSSIGKKSFIENIRNQRRVSVDSSNLEFFSSLHGSTIRSINCSKRYIWRPGFIRKVISHRLDFLESVRLLRVLDGECFYVQDLLTLVYLDELFHLRYLAISYHGGFPISLGLQNLQTLVILTTGERHISGGLHLKWCMSQLRHVYYYGIIDFEDPKETDYPLESLQTLSYVSLSTCRERILKMIPNLKKLQIKCSKGLPSDGGVFLDDLVHLHQLEDLEILAGEQVEYYKGTFPRMLKKLILREWKLPWNDIFCFGSLPNLQVLKLIDCTCVGGTWETTEDTFPVLEVLKISKSSFENWLTESSHFPRLKLLQLHSCKDLNEIPNDIGEIPTLQLVEVKGRARESLVESVEQIRHEQEEMGNETLQVVCNAKTTDSDDERVMVCTPI